MYGFETLRVAPFASLKSHTFRNNFILKITLGIPSQSFDLGMLSPMCLKQKVTVNHSNVNLMEKQKFPRSHTFRLGAKHRGDLVRPVNSIHFHVLGFLKVSLLIVHPFLLLFICIAHSCYHGQNDIVYPPQHQAGWVPHPVPIAHSLWFLRVDGKLRLQLQLYV